MATKSYRLECRLSENEMRTLDAKAGSFAMGRTDCIRMLINLDVRAARPGVPDETSIPLVTVGETVELAHAIDGCAAAMLALRENLDTIIRLADLLGADKLDAEGLRKWLDGLQASLGGWEAALSKADRIVTKGVAVTGTRAAQGRL